VNFLITLSKNAQTSDCMKIRPVGTKLFACGRTDGQTTDMRKKTVAFRDFTKAPKKLS